MTTTQYWCCKCKRAVAGIISLSYSGGSKPYRATVICHSKQEEKNFDYAELLSPKLDFFDDQIILEAQVKYHVKEKGKVAEYYIIPAPIAQKIKRLDDCADQYGTAVIGGIGSRRQIDATTIFYILV